MDKEVDMNTLGGLKVLSQKERLDYYAAHETQATDDHRAASLARVQWLYQAFPTHKPKHILDIGCNDGFITRWAVDEPYVETLLGIDPSVHCINNAKEFIQKRYHPEKCLYDNAGWESLDENHLYDAIVCFEVLEHFLFPEGEKLLTLMHNKLTPEGRAYMCTPNINGVYGKENPDPHHIGLWGRDGLNTALVNLGAKSTEWVGYSETCPHLMVSWGK